MKDGKFTAFEIEFMREDLASDFSLTKIIENTRKRFEESGRDFDKELEEYSKNKKKEIPNSYLF